MNAMRQNSVGYRLVFQQSNQSALAAEQEPVNKAWRRNAHSGVAKEAEKSNERPLGRSFNKWTWTWTC